jgi:hypothetical protein
MASLLGLKRDTNNDKPKEKKKNQFGEKLQIKTVGDYTIITLQQEKPHGPLELSTPAERKEREKT